MATDVALYLFSSLVYLFYLCKIYLKECSPCFCKCTSFLLEYFFMTDILMGVSVFKVQINFCLFRNADVFVCYWPLLVTELIHGVIMKASLLLMDSRFSERFKHLLSLALDLSLFTIYYLRPLKITSCFNKIDSIFQWTIEDCFCHMRKNMLL